MGKSFLRFRTVFFGLLFACLINLSGMVFLVIWLRLPVALAFVLPVPGILACFGVAVALKTPLQIVTFDDAGIHLRYFKKEMQFYRWSDVQYATTAFVQRWVTDYAIYCGRNEAGVEQWFYCEKRRKIKSVLTCFLRPEQWR